MSLDLSQLDRLARGEEDSPLVSSKSVPSRPVEPQLTRRRLRGDKRSVQLSNEGEDLSEVLSMGRDDGSGRHPVDISAQGCQQLDLALSVGHTSKKSDLTSRRAAQIREREKKLRRMKETPQKRETEDKVTSERVRRVMPVPLERMEKLANVADISDLPLCDLISRAGYLEEKAILRESKTKKPAVVPDLKPEPAAAHMSHSVFAPQVTVKVDLEGKLVVNEESLERNTEIPIDEARSFVRVEENEDRVVNYHSYTPWSTSRPSRWSKEETDLLIQGIGQFGIDFTLLQRLFPNRGRKSIKTKFSKLWKEDPEIFGRYFNRSTGDMERSYDKLTRDLRAERTSKSLSLPETSP